MRPPSSATWWIAWAIFLCGCLVAAHRYYQLMEYRTMYKMPDYLTKFDVQEPAPACARWRDQMPKKRNPDVYRSYIAARKLWRSKGEWDLSREELIEILTSVQDAAKKGDWGAKALLAHFYLEGLGALKTNNVLPMDRAKAVEIEREAVANGQAWGFYDLGVAHEYGYGGVAQDKEIAWAYYLKAAKLGSPEAQITLADAYLEAGKHEQRKLMLDCAYAQGHGPAAYELAILAVSDNRSMDALRYYQSGVKFGNIDCARVLFLAFDGQVGKRYQEELLHPLGFVADPERSRRYEDITDALQLNSDLKFGRLDAVLPLPPAALSEWDGIASALTLESDSPPTY